MDEIRCSCNNCGEVWFTTERDIIDADHIERALHRSRMFLKINIRLKGKNSMSKARIRELQEFALLKANYKKVDPMHCPHCGTANITVL